MAVVTDYAEPYRRDLKSGFPEHIVVRAATQHLMGLGLLPDGTEDKDRAQADLDAFLAEHPDAPEANRP